MTLALRSRPSAVTDSKWPASTSRTSEVTKTVNGGARTLLAACGPASRARIGSAYAMVSFVIERPTDAFGWTCADLTLLTYRLKVHKVH